MEWWAIRIHVRREIVSVQRRYRPLRSLRWIEVHEQRAGDSVSLRAAR